MREAAIRKYRSCRVPRRNWRRVRADSFSDCIDGSARLCDTYWHVVCFSRARRCTLRLPPNSRARPCARGRVCGAPNSRHRATQRPAGRCTRPPKVSRVFPRRLPRRDLPRLGARLQVGGAPAVAGGARPRPSRAARRGAFAEIAGRPYASSRAPTCCSRSRRWRCATRSSPRRRARFRRGALRLPPRPGRRRDAIRALVRTVARLPRRQTRVLTWPVVTVFGFIAQPRDAHLPEAQRHAHRRRAYGFDFRYRSRPPGRRTQKPARVREHRPPRHARSAAARHDRPAVVHLGAGRTSTTECNGAYRVLEYRYREWVGRWNAVSLTRDALRRRTRTSQLSGS